MCVCCYVFFNDTAATEIYTYLHTLSLHDALPICPSYTVRSRFERALRILLTDARTVSPMTFLCSTNTDAQTGPSQRSEEHTSELQSLMRISYAVFCLKKKKTIHKVPSRHLDKQ